MKILIIGGDGMLGHQMLKQLKLKHDVRVVLRQEYSHYSHLKLFEAKNCYTGIDIRRDFEDLIRIFSDFKPNAVINAVGIIKQRKAAKDIFPSIEINTLFPHRLYNLCQTIGARMIHFSTDCVFSGKTGNYSELDLPDSEDLYGKSKHLGEIDAPHCVTIRSSIIGLELSRKLALLEWFLAQSGTIKGYRHAIYSGLTTIEMSRLVEIILESHLTLSGVWHVSSNPISKFDLLSKLAALLNRDDISILPDDSFKCERSLNSNKFREATGYVPPSQADMLAELANEIKLTRYSMLKT